MDEGSNEKIVKLLLDLLEYYEVYFQEEILSTDQNIKNGENVTTEVLLRICDVLECDILEIVERIIND